jgi:GXWXG protein/Domain of unknown function (DUF4334)
MHIDELLPSAPTTTAGALDLFDGATAVDPTFLIGMWRGAELPTGHPLDGLLATSGWWGKQFVDAETVHPLLFPTRDGRALWALNPAVAFGGLAVASAIPALKSRSFAGPIAKLRPALRTRKPKARLRTTRYRGVDTATMIYDQLPVNDVFRRITGAAGEEMVLGAMDLRGSAIPYFFVLQRDHSMGLR